jgi:hypothetical protein
MQDKLLNSGNVNLFIKCIRSSDDVGTRNHGFSLIASLAKAFPQLVTESIVDLFVAIGDAVKQVCSIFSFQSDPSAVCCPWTFLNQFLTFFT